MMRYRKLLLGVLAVLVLAACDDDGITGPRNVGDMAVIRFVNVVTDTGTVDFRFMDKVENLPTLLGVAFRSHSGMYQRAAAGTRPTRIFPNSTDPTMTQVMLVDTTLTLAANTRYTYVYAGRANGNQDRLAVFEDPATIPTPAAGNIAIKALHAAIGAGTVDVYIVPVATTSTATPADFATNNAGVVRNLGYLTQSAYVEVPARPTSAFYRFVVTDAGSTTALFASTPNLPGSAAVPGNTYGALPGVQVAGSVLTLVVAPGSVPGTRQSVAANQTPTTFLMIDKVLNP